MRDLCPNCHRMQHSLPSERGVQYSSASVSPDSDDGSCDSHVTAPLVIYNTNVLYINYHQCCHASLSDIKLSPSHCTKCSTATLTAVLCTCPPITLTLSPTPSTHHPHPVTHSTSHTVTITPHKHTRLVSTSLPTKPTHQMHSIWPV